jgi:urea transport system ATP-binding protein
MLGVTSLYSGYGESEVLHGLEFRVAKDEIVAVLGRNGMGKSTLMRTLIGLLPARGGRIELDGTAIERMKPFERAAAGVGYVPQGRMIFGTMTVKENIETGLSARGESRVPDDIYELFPVLEEMRDRKGGNLSGGQQQQLAIARALATQPRVLLLDEPTEGIQPSIIQDLARVLKTIRDRRGLCIVVSEQVLGFALEIADRILVLENGRIVVDSRAGDVDEDQITRLLAV